MFIRDKIRSYGPSLTQTERHTQFHGRKPGSTTRKITRKIIGASATGLLLLVTPIRLGADPLAPSAGEIITQCEDRTGTSSPDAQRRDDCDRPWAEELHDEYQDRGGANWWEHFRVGPQAMSEQELSLLYRPGERRPLWGY
jgi:hypothetical protein